VRDRVGRLQQQKHLPRVQAPRRGGRRHPRRVLRGGPRQLGRDGAAERVDGVADDALESRERTRGGDGVVAGGGGGGGRVVVVVVVVARAVVVERLGANARADASSAVDDDATGRRRASPASSSSARIARAPRCRVVVDATSMESSIAIDRRACRRARRDPTRRVDSNPRVARDARLRAGFRARTTREAPIARALATDG